MRLREREIVCVNVCIYYCVCVFVCVYLSIFGCASKRERENLFATICYFVFVWCVCDSICLLMDVGKLNARACECECIFECVHLFTECARACVRVCEKVWT
jgi:hypothetical protein